MWWLAAPEATLKQPPDMRAPMFSAAAPWLERTAGMDQGKVACPPCAGGPPEQQAMGRKATMTSPAAPLKSANS